MFKNFRKNFLKCIFFLTYVFSSVCFGEISDEKLKKSAQDLEPIILNAMRELNIPGCAFIVVRNDRIIHMGCFGKTEGNFKMSEKNKRIIKKNDPDNKNSDDISRDTLFPLSSLTKNITGFIAASLVQDGIIKFDDKVRSYIPDFFIGNEHISSECTIRDLVSHRTGIRHFSGDSLWSAGYPKEKIVNSLRYIKKIKGFRTKYGYQNIIFGISGDVFEKASGLKYEDLAQKYIFSKLNLNHSSAIPLMYERGFFDYLKYRCSRFSYDMEKLGFFSACRDFIVSIFNHNSKKISRNMSGYEGNVNILELNDYYQKLPATSSVAMSIEDLGTWIQMILSKGSYKGTQIISPENFDELTSNIIEVKELKDDNLIFPKKRISDIHYGMGFFTADYGDNGKNKRHIMFHMGGIYGSGTFFACIPSENFAIGILCNFGGTSQTLFAELMSDQFLDMCFDFSKVDWVHEEVLHNEKNNEYKSRLHKEFIEKNMGSSEKMENYTGVYSSDIYGDMKVSIENDQLVIDNGIRRAKLDHVIANIFSFEAPDLCLNYFDRKEYVMFYKDDKGLSIDSMYISALDEGNNIFKRK